jgi:hypothetical protein
METLCDAWTEDQNLEWNYIKQQTEVKNLK